MLGEGEAEGRGVGGVALGPDAGYDGRPSRGRGVPGSATPLERPQVGAERAQATHRAREPEDTPVSLAVIQGRFSRHNKVGQGLLTQTGAGAWLTLPPTPPAPTAPPTAPHQEASSLEKGLPPFCCAS